MKKQHRKKLTLNGRMEVVRRLDGITGGMYTDTDSAVCNSDGACGSRQCIEPSVNAPCPTLGCPSMRGPFNSNCGCTHD